MQGFDSSSPAPEQVRADSTGICKESHLVPLPGFLSFPGFLFFRGGGGTGRFRLRPAKPMGVSPRGFDSRFRPAFAFLVFLVFPVFPVFLVFLVFSVFGVGWGEAV